MNIQKTIFVFFASICTTMVSIEAISEKKKLRMELEQQQKQINLIFDNLFEIKDEKIFKNNLIALIEAQSSNSTENNPYKNITKQFLKNSYGNYSQEAEKAIDKINEIALEYLRLSKKIFKNQESKTQENINAGYRITTIIDTLNERIHALSKPWNPTNFRTRYSIKLAVHYAIKMYQALIAFRNLK